MVSIMVSQNLSGRIRTEVRRLRTEQLLTMVSGWFRGYKQISNGVLDLKHDWTREMVRQIDVRFTPDNVPYLTGHMYNAFKNELRRSPEGWLRLGAGNVPYAGFVDAMVPPIHWTGGGNRYYWFRRALRFMESIIMPVLRAVIRRVGLAPAMGTSVGQIATAVEPK